MTLQRLFAAAAAAIALVATSQAARAAVEYDFTALSSYPLDSGEDFTGSFSVTLPGFVKADTTLPVGSLTSCTAVSNLGPASCLDPSLLFHVTANHVTVEISYTSATTPDVGIFYYFDPSAFSTPGSYQTDIFGANQAGTLVVTSTSAVPEPGPWLLMALGATALTIQMRRMAGRKTTP